MDYLCVDPKRWKNTPKNIEMGRFLDDATGNAEIYKSFTGPNPDITELTDEIAKLRPMVHNGRENKVYEKLIYIQEDAPTDDRYIYHTVNGVFENRQLATAHELQEKNNG
jgi:hypothetical protein